MKKKIVSIAIASIFTLGFGNVVLAHAGSSDNSWSFEEMLPHMKDMHPEMNEQQMGQKCKGCHGSVDKDIENVPMNNQI
ncbi:MAG TPA: hypothetical protein VK067_00380 [Pseudogracilibacillus sp.]|nr:hypothetical protein [Pseudogracilibacillus sp.]